MQSRTSREKGRKSGRNRQSGFTLLEVMVAVLILGLAYVAVLQNFSLSFSNVLRVEESKRRALAGSLEVDRLLRPADQEENSNTAGAIYLEGRRFQLVLVGSTTGELVSLKLMRKI